jgi:multiple sugar transport system substrate-binding protein
MRKLLLVSLIFALLFTASVLGVVTLEYWTGFTGPDGRFMQELVSKFNEEHKGEIQVNMSTMLWGDYNTKVPIALASGKGPDVGIAHVDNIRSFVSQGMLLPLDSYLAIMNMKEGDIVPSVWEAVHVDSSVYGIPLDVHPLVFYWNKELFRQAGLDPENPPATGEEFIKAAIALTKDINGDGNIDQWGSMIPVGWPNYFMWFSAFFSNGGELFNEDLTRATFNSAAGIDSMQFFVDLIFEHKVSPEKVQVDADVDAFKRGTCAMEFNGIWMLTSYQDVEGLDFGAGPVPQFGSERAANWAGSHTMVIYKQRKQDLERTEAAARFISWISNHSYEWALAGQIPANISVQNSIEFQALPYHSSIAKGAVNVVFPPFFPKYGDATGPIWEALNLALLGQKTVVQALKDAERISNEILQD